MINILELEASKGWGGQEKRTVRLINGLDKSKYKVYFGAFPDSKIAQNRSQIDATLLPLKIANSYDVFAIWRVVGFVKKYRINIISTHSGKDGWIGAIAGKIAGVPVVRTRHLQTPINSPFSYNLSTKVVTVSNQVNEYLASVGVKKEKLMTIYTGVDTNQYNPTPKKSLKDELGVSKECVLIGIVAVLRSAKRHDMLIRAIADLSNSHLVIVGSGPQEENLKNLVADLGYKERVHMLGHREDVSEILPSLDIFVLPSKMEALGTAILEASACGVPCVGSRVGGIPECIEDGKSGLLFDDEAGLKKALERLCSDEALREQMGKRARELVCEKFSNEVMIKKTEELYDELAKQ